MKLGILHFAEVNLTMPRHRQISQLSSTTQSTFPIDTPYHRKMAEQPSRKLTSSHQNA